MKRLIRFIFPIFLLCLCACDQDASTQSAELSSSDTLTTTTTTTLPDGQEREDTIAVSDSLTICVRGTPSPIIDRVLHPDATFRMQPDSAVAYESVVFRNNDKVRIKHWGCEYFLMTFRFETSRFKADTSQTSYWYRTAATLLGQTRKAITDHSGTTELLDQSIVALLQQSEAQPAPGLRKEIDFGNGDIRNYVILEKVSKLSRKKYMIEVTTVVGPL